MQGVIALPVEPDTAIRSGPEPWLIDDGIDRGLLYVALTRAEDMLVILHSGSSSYVDELYRALGPAPP